MPSQVFQRQDGSWAVRHENGFTEPLEVAPGGIVGPSFADGTGGAQSLVSQLGQDSAVAAGVKAIAQLQSLVSTKTATMVSLGDSIVANGLSNGGPDDQNWLAIACYLSNGKLTWLNSVGGSGYTTEQIRTILLPSVLAMSPKPAYCAVLAGQNDIGGQTTFTSWKASYRGLVAELIQAGIMPVICAITPNDLSPKNTNMAKWNLWLFRLSQENGLPFINWSRDLTNPADNAWLSGYNLPGDNTHPDRNGCLAMGTFFRDAFLAWISGDRRLDPPLVVYNGDPSNKHSNGMNLTDTNSDGLADNWFQFNVTTGGAVGTPTRVDPDGSDTITKGKWQKIVRNEGAASTFCYIRSNTDFAMSAGQRWAVGCRFQCDIAEADPIGQVGQVGISDTTSNTNHPQLRWFVNNITYDIPPTTFWQEFVVDGAGIPNGAGRFLSNFTSGEGSWQVAQVTVYNLTELDVLDTDLGLA